MGALRAAFGSSISTQSHQLLSEVLTLEHADESFGRRRQTIGDGFPILDSTRRHVSGQRHQPTIREPDPVRLLPGRSLLVES